MSICLVNGSSSPALRFPYTYCTFLETTAAILTSTFCDTIVPMENRSSSISGQHIDKPIEMQVTPAPTVTLQIPSAQHSYTNNHNGEAGGATNRRSGADHSRVFQANPKPKSLRETLEKCIPTNSAMMHSIWERRPNALLVNENHPEGMRWDIGTMDANLKELHDNVPRSGGTVLIIEDIDEQFGQFLLTEFGQDVSPEFLARHMIRLDSQSAVEHAKNVLGPSLRVPGQHRSHKVEDHLLLALTLPLEQETKGFHVDCDFSSVVESPSTWGSTRVVTKTMQVSGGKISTTGISFSFGVKDNSIAVVGSSERSIGVGGARTDWIDDTMGVSGHSSVEKPKEVKMQKTRTRLSCCQLEEDFCEDPPLMQIGLLGADSLSVDLVLVEATPDLSSGKKPLWDSLNGDPFQRLLSFSFRMDKELPVTVLRSPIVIEQGTSNCMITTALRLFQHHTPQSVFQPKDVPFFNPRDVPDSNGKCHILVWLLVESTWQLAVASLDSRLQRLRRKAANETSDKAFSLLKDFRREVADARMLIAELRERYIQAVGEAESWIVATSSGLDDQQKTVKKGVDDFWLQERTKPAPVIFGRAQSMDIKNLPETLEKLEQHINAMTQTVNEEIQVVIGSVQIEDAKTMKRQAEWTVVLAVLAAVYLPMTLVSGLFGMNIVEITTTEGAPGKWSVVKAWGVAFGATVGTIIIYAAGRIPVTWLMRNIQKHQEAQVQKSRAKALAKERLEKARAEADGLEATV